MSDVVVASLISTLSALTVSVFGFFISYKLLRSEYLNKYRIGLIEKQISACEKLWSVLSVASKSKIKGNILDSRAGKIYINIKITSKLHKDLIEAINSPSGLYYSKNLRDTIIQLRDFLESEFSADFEKNENSIISTTKAGKLDGYVQNVRISIRKEIKLEDLNVAREDPI